MSKLTDAQLQAAIASSSATAAKHEANGNHRAAAAARARAWRNEEELRSREGLGAESPKQEAPETFRVIPNAVVPDDAVRDAGEIATKWGTTALVRACVAVLNERTSFRDSMDVADANRVIAMRRRAGA